MAKPTGVNTTVIHLRIGPKLRDAVREAAAEMEWEDQQIIRESTKIGLEVLRRVNFDLAKIAVDADEKARTP